MPRVRRAHPPSHSSPTFLTVGPTVPRAALPLQRRQRPVGHSIRGPDDGAIAAGTDWAPMSPPCHHPMAAAPGAHWGLTCPLHSPAASGSPGRHAVGRCHSAPGTSPSSSPCRSTNCCKRSHRCHRGGPTLHPQNSLCYTGTRWETCPLMSPGWYPSSPLLVEMPPQLLDGCPPAWCPHMGSTMAAAHHRPCCPPAGCVWGYECHPCHWGKLVPKCPIGEIWDLL